MSSSAPVYWNHPSILNGRIEPENANELVGPDGYYAGAGDLVFCLGVDKAVLPARRIWSDDTSSVAQAAVDLTAVDVIHFSWKLRTSVVMPSPRTLVDGGSVVFATSDFVTPGDTSCGVELPYPGSLFLQADKERIVRVSGTSTVNDNDFTLVAIPWEQGRASATGAIRNGQLGILYRGGLSLAAGTYPAATVKLLGFRWIARAYIDTSLLVESYGPVGSPENQDLTLHVSKSAGLHTLTFSVELEAYE